MVDLARLRQLLDDDRSLSTGSLNRDATNGMALVDIAERLDLLIDVLSRQRTTRRWRSGVGSLRVTEVIPSEKPRYRLDQDRGGSEYYRCKTCDARVLLATVPYCPNCEKNPSEEGRTP